MSELPEGWVSCRLGDYIRLKNGFAFKSTDFVRNSENTTPVIRISNIAGRYCIDSNAVHIPKSKVVDGFEIETGDLLIAMSGATTGKVGVYIGGEPAYQNQRVGNLKLVSNELGSLPFRNHLIANLSDQILKAAYGGAQPNISGKDIENFEISLPPLNEQKRIAAKLDALLEQVDACRARLDRVPLLLKRFRQAVLAAAYTGKLTEEFRESQYLTPIAESLSLVDTPIRPHRFSSMSETIIEGDYALAVGKPDREIPQGWEWTPLVEIARMESGHTPSRKHPEYWGGDVAWIGIADARDGHGKTITTTYQHTNQLGLKNSAARLLPAGTVCLSRTASVGYVVRMGVSMATSQDFANWSCTTAIEPDWLKFLFVAETTAIYRFGKGTTHTTVYYPELMAFHVALPPIEEQREIVRRVETLFAYADRLEERYKQARAAVERLTPALLAKAFRGELVPQDPTDEPASVLLERIQAQREIQAKKPKIITPKTPAKSAINLQEILFMLTPAEIQGTHLTNILKSEGSLTAEALWLASELEIDDFYEQLKTEEAAGLLRELLAESNDQSRMLEAA